MPKYRHRAILEKTLLAIAAVFLLVGIIALGFLQTLSKENRALIVIVTCKQLPNLVEIRSIHSLHLEMKKAEAVRGFYWSPGGFTDEAIHWARQKPIILADQNEIGRLVDCAHEKGSTLLEI